jgi:hypothetical protein
LEDLDLGLEPLEVLNLDSRNDLDGAFLPGDLMSSHMDNAIRATAQFL